MTTIKNQWLDVSFVKIEVKVTVFFYNFASRLKYMALVQLYLDLLFTTKGYSQ